ncbi:MAG: hypothetical protein POELPBGB_02757 [Bacteroidia bacterium]|nr:hypothetical protein [Bacteroidia bacterium]
MVYPILKIFVRLALKIFCGDIDIHNHRALNSKGPLLITANHPNSFFDAVIIGALFKEPVHFLARGDAFKKTWHNALLKTLNMIPIYRLSEGKENLHLNEKTFQRSQEILSKNGIVLIFIEGLCVQEYGLRSFKKGAARIALNCHNVKIPLKILPLGINYSDFKKVGMRVEVHPGKLLHPDEIFKEKDTASNLLAFNNSVYEEFEKLVWKENKNRRPVKNYWIVLFAFLGNIIHSPFYYPVKNFVAKKTKDTVFYHAVLFGILLFTYPLFVGLLSLLIILAGVNKFIALSVFILLPLLAYAAVQQRKYSY